MTDRADRPADRHVSRIELDVPPEAALFEVAGALPAPAFLDSTLTADDAWTILTAGPSATVVEGLPDWRPSRPPSGPSRPSLSGVDVETSGDRVEKPIDRSPEFHSSSPRSTGPHRGSTSLPGKTAATDPEDIRPPFGSGWIGFLTYESAPLWNADLATREPEGEVGSGFPRALWHRYEAALAYRHSDRTWWISRLETDAGRRGAAALLACLRRSAETRTEGRICEVHVGEIQADLSRKDYEAQVSTIRKWIERGHTYQTNLTYRMRAPFEGRGLDLYPSLRRTSPVPFGAYVRPDLPGTPLPSLELLAATPELFLSISGDRIVTRPIKGTRPRDLADPGRDRALARELFLSPKDRAELTMIVDLERNDLGQICRHGTVRTGAFPRVESYRGVHHLVADVRGDLAPGTTLRDILHATFPGGSVTGAPKIRSMELIRDLETTSRGIYTGALGYLDDRGSAVLSLTIRTLWVTPGPSREIRFGVGGGIVTDSVPELEWDETKDKARTLLEALHPQGDRGAARTATGPGYA